MSECVGCLARLLNEAEFAEAESKLTDMIASTANMKERKRLIASQIGLIRYSEKYASKLDDGNMLCGDCTFIVAMYKENGIDKKFRKGGLALHTVSNNIRKAVMELRENPTEAYKKYLPKTMKECDGVLIPDKMMKAILSEEFPFVKLPVRQSEALGLKEGDSFRAHSNDGSYFKRTIMAIRKFTAKESKEKGYGRNAFVAYFVPAEA
jgi:hypothetical protein